MSLALSKHERSLYAVHWWNIIQKMVRIEKKEKTVQKAVEAALTILVPQMVVNANIAHEEIID